MTANRVVGYYESSRTLPLCFGFALAQINVKLLMQHKCFFIYFDCLLIFLICF